MHSNGYPNGHAQQPNPALLNQPPPHPNQQSQPQQQWQPQPNQQQWQQQQPQGQGASHAQPPHPGAGYGQSGMAPQPQAPQPQAPAMGLSHDGGDFRVHFDGGAFSPSNLIAAVTTGKGFDKPRVFGLGLLGLALAFTAGNYVLITVLNYYFPYLYSLGAIFGWAGMWLAVTGEPRARQDGSAAPSWGRYGLLVCLVVGLLSGIAMVAMPWEAAL